MYISFFYRKRCTHKHSFGMVLSLGTYLAYIRIRPTPQLIIVVPLLVMVLCQCSIMNHMLLSHLCLSVFNTSPTKISSVYSPESTNLPLSLLLSSTSCPPNYHRYIFRSPQTNTKQSLRYSYTTLTLTFTGFPCHPPSSPLRSSKLWTSML